MGNASSTGVRATLAERIQAILPAQAPGPGAQPERIAAFFRQSFDLVPDVHAHIGAQERSYARLSHGLLDVLANIEMAPLRLHVLATAGNGKTLVARHFFDQCLERGRRPLLLCFNRPLAERLAHITARGGRVATWFQFCDLFLRSRGVVLDFESMAGDPGFWATAARRVLELALEGRLPADWRFDTLIVDEAQDFEGDWLETARLFLAPDADILWLEDPNQNLRGAEAVALRGLGFVGYRSLLNYRSPVSIADFIARALPELPFIGANDLPGLGVGVTAYADPSEQPRLAGRLVGRLVGRLLGERFRPQDISPFSPAEGSGARPSVTSNGSVTTGSRGLPAATTSSATRSTRPARSCSTRCAASRASRAPQWCSPTSTPRSTTSGASSRSSSAA